jgi:tRNA (guanosine-2'-O-)-methyltransferase
MPQPNRLYRQPEHEFFTGIVMENNKCEQNLGIIARTACVMGAADFLGTIGERYHRPRTDVCDSYRRLPFWHFKDSTDFFDHVPSACDVVGIELDDRAIAVEEFQWPKRVAIVFGTEGDGLSSDVRQRARYLIKLPSVGISMNVSSAASIVIWERFKWLRQNGFAI